MSLPALLSSEGLHDAYVLAVFATVYLGMIWAAAAAGHLDRTGVALLGAIAIVGAEVMTLRTPPAPSPADHPAAAVLLHGDLGADAPGRFYGAVTRRIAALPVGPAALMGVVIAVSAVLSAVFSNDIVCLAVAPVLAEACLRRRLDQCPSCSVWPARAISARPRR